MADESISQMPDGGLIQTTDALPIVRTGVNYKANVGQSSAKNVTNNSLPLVASVNGTFTANNLVVATDAPGTLTDSGINPNTLAPLASPALTGVPTAPTATVGTNTTQVATTAFVLANGGTSSGVNSVSGSIVDNTDPRNPRVTQVQSDWDASSGLASIQNKPSNITTQGNTFNGNSELVQLDSSGHLPAVNASAVTGITESQITGLTSDLAAKAPLASPALTGVPTAPTATVGTNTTQVATTAFVLANGGTSSGVNSVSGSIVDNTDPRNPRVTQVQSDWDASSGLASIQNKPSNITTQGNTFNGNSELVQLDSSGHLPAVNASAVTGITESQITGLTSDLAAKAPLASPALTGVPTAPTATVGTNTTQLATTAFVLANAVIGPSQYTGELNNTGGTAPSYATLNSAYAANKTYLLTVANVTEVANTSIDATDQIYIKLGQNNNWNLGGYHVDGTQSGASFTVEFSDPSSVFQIQESVSGNLPFVNFDYTTALIFKCNGGTIQNLSTVDNTYIEASGSFLMNGAYFLLPNQLGGGLRTHGETMISNCEFVGAGNATDVALIVDGGQLVNIIFSGSWLNGTNLNYANASFVAANITVNIDSPSTFNINGATSNIVNIGSSILTLNMYSNSSVTNGQVDYATFLTTVSNCQVSGITFSGGAVFAGDNSNSNIQFSNVTFNDQVQVYGTNITFSNCHFLNGLITNTGSSGSIVGCISDSLVTAPLGSFVRAGNNANIGNDYSESPLIINGTLGTPLLVLSPSGGALKTSATFTTNTTNSSTVTIAALLPDDNTTYSIKGTIRARRTGGTSGSAGDSAVFDFFGGIKNIGSVVSLIGGDFYQNGYSDQPSSPWTIAFLASGDTFQIQVQGAINNNITWDATLDYFGR